MLDVRPAQPADAAAIVALLNELAATSDQMVLTPIDPARTGAVADHVGRLAAGGTEFMLLGLADGAVAGFLLTSAEKHPDRRGVVEIDIGITERHRRRGLGRRLLAAAEAEARHRGIHRLQLRVLTGNEAAIALYRAAGFETEGLMRAVLRRKGRLHDQYLMAKLLKD
jgi:L-amino acid N-acyltransferase YncA